MRFTRYHIRHGQRRTTVSVDTHLSSYLALRLGHRPQSPEAHQAVRHWLQQRLDEHNDPGRVAVSQWLQGEVIDAIVDKTLSSAYADYLLGPYDDLTSRTTVR